MWECYIGEISASYREQWEPHTVKPDQKEPDVFDVLAGCTHIGYRLDMRAAAKYFPENIQVDWGGWAYKVTKEQILKYNEEAGYQFLIPEHIIESMDPERDYAIIDVEYG